MMVDINEIEARRLEILQCNNELNEEFFKKDQYYTEAISEAINKGNYEELNELIANQEAFMKEHEEKHQDIMNQLTTLLNSF